MSLVLLPFSLANEHQVKATCNLKTACTATDKKIHFASIIFRYGNRAYLKEFQRLHIFLWRQIISCWKYKAESNTNVRGLINLIDELQKHIKVAHARIY